MGVDARVVGTRPTRRRRAASRASASAPDSGPAATSAALHERGASRAIESMMCRVASSTVPLLSRVVVGPRDVAGDADQQHRDRHDPERARPRERARRSRPRSPGSSQRREDVQVAAQLGGARRPRRCDRTAAISRNAAAPISSAVGRTSRPRVDAEPDSRTASTPPPTSTAAEHPPHAPHRAERAEDARRAPVTHQSKIWRADPDERVLPVRVPQPPGAVHGTERNGVQRGDPP